MPALSAYLADPAKKEVIITDLYTFALVDGTVLRYAGWVSALTVPSASFPAGSLNVGASRLFTRGPVFGRSQANVQIGVAATELDIAVFPRTADLIGTFSFADAARQGFFDGATVELDRLFSAPQAGGGTIDTTTLGCLVWFYGRVAEIEIGRSKVGITVKSLMALLEGNQFPRRIYQSACNHVFGDAMCGYDRVAGENALGDPTGLGALTVTADTGTVQNLITATTSVDAAYSEGTITGLTGPNAGISRTIAWASGTSVSLWKPFPYTIAVGNTFTALPGCNHSVGACEDTFDNLARYGGFPWIPPPEAAILWALSVFSAVSAGLFC